jgi:hypothetical protein
MSLAFISDLAKGSTRTGPVTFAPRRFVVYTSTQFCMCWWNRCATLPTQFSFVMRRLKLVILGGFESFHVPTKVRLVQVYNAS